MEQADHNSKNPPNVPLTTERIIKERDERRKRLLERLEQQKNVVIRNYSETSLRYPQRSIETKIRDTEEEREKVLKNDALKQDIELKRTTLNRLFKLLISETVVIFILAFLQGFKLHKFYLEEWSFRLLVAVTITQITIMLQFAVKHLFPQSSKK